MTRCQIEADETDLTPAHDNLGHEVARAQVGLAREPGLLVVELAHQGPVVDVRLVDPHVGRELDALSEPGSRQVPGQGALWEREAGLGRDPPQYDPDGRLFQALQVPAVSKSAEAPSYRVVGRVLVPGQDRTIYYIVSAKSPIYMCVCLFVCLLPKGHETLVLVLNYTCLIMYKSNECVHVVVHVRHPGAHTFVPVGKMGGKYSEQN